MSTQSCCLELPSVRVPLCSLNFCQTSQHFFGTWITLSSSFFGGRRHGHNWLYSWQHQGTTGCIAGRCVVSGNGWRKQKRGGTGKQLNAAWPVCYTTGTAAGTATGCAAVELAVQLAACRRRILNICLYRPFFRVTCLKRAGVIQLLGNRRH